MADFLPLPEREYSVIYADPPWQYRQHGTTEKSRGTALKQYPTMATVVDGDRLLWCGDNEVVALDTVRKARSSWAKEWERAVWNALEGVDLHKEEA